MSMRSVYSGSPVKTIRSPVSNLMFSVGMSTMSHEAWAVEATGLVEERCLPSWSADVAARAPIEPSFTA